MILEEQFPMPRNNAESKIGNGAILFLWQLRCHCNPDHIKFSSLSNTTVVAIFPNRRIDPEKLHLVTLTQLQNCNNTQKITEQISLYKYYKITTV